MQAMIPNPAVPIPAKEALLSLYKGKDVNTLQTPHLIIDRSQFVKNCAKMRKAVETIGWDFRAHIKTHKTAEGTQLQCEHTATGRIIVSTLPELYAVINAGLIANGLVKDVLYSMPMPAKLFPVLLQCKQELEKHGAELRLMIDHPAQISVLDKALAGTDVVWSIYLKLDIGSKRAGLPPQSDAMGELIKAAVQSSHVSIFGTYTHANFSYGSKDSQTAAQYLALEVSSANEAAQRVVDIAKSLGAGASKFDKDGLRLAVGATPTAHAAHTEWEAARDQAGVGKGKLVGKVELHAGNYCLLDSQQMATSLIDVHSCAMFVGATILSSYEERNEAVCDAGAIAMSKDTGPFPGYGPVVEPSLLNGWSLGRTSQEHGILVGEGKLPTLGDYVRIVPQHACLTAAQHSWFYVTDGDNTVADIWVPCKGW